MICYCQRLFKSACAVNAMERFRYHYQVDDVVLGVVTPIGEQGGDIAKFGHVYGGWDQQVPGVQINRFCSSGLESINMAAMKVRSGWEELVIAGGVESMSRNPMGSDGGAWYLDPAVNSKLGFIPQGISMQRFDCNAQKALRARRLIITPCNRISVLLMHVKMVTSKNLLFL